MRRLIVMAVFTLAASSCATRSATTAGSNTPTSRSTTSRTNLISSDEINAAQTANTAADLVRTLRPNWKPASIFIGNFEFGGRLSDIDARTIKEIQFLTAPEAQMRWGLRVQEVILITRK